MQGIRLSTLMLLIVIAAMGITLFEQNRRATSREIELNGRITRLEKSKTDLTSLVRELRGALNKPAPSPTGPDGAAGGRK